MRITATDSVDISGRFNLESFSFADVLPRFGNYLFSGLSSQTAGRGNGGRISVITPYLIMADGSLIAADSRAAGRGGDIEVQARELRLTGGAVISATSSGLGNAGNLHLTADATVQIARSTVTTEAIRASGGNMALRAGSLLLLEESALSASVAGGPETVGGTLTLAAPSIISQGSQFIANAFAGRGGTISIGARVFLADPASLVSASSELGISGTVDIQAPVTSLSGVVAPLPQTFGQVAAFLPEGLRRATAGADPAAWSWAGAVASRSSPAVCCRAPLPLVSGWQPIRQ